LVVTAVTVAADGATVTTFEGKGTMLLAVVAEIVACAELATVPAVRGNVRLLWPARTVTVGGAGTGSAAELLLTRVTVSPPAGATPLSVTVPVVVCPETMFAGLKVSPVTTGGGFTVSAAVKELAAGAMGSVTVMFAVSVVGTASALILNVPLVCPTGMLKLGC